MSSWANGSVGGGNGSESQTPGDEDYIDLPVGSIDSDTYSGTGRASARPKMTVGKQPPQYSSGALCTSPGEGRRQGDIIVA